MESRRVSQVKTLLFTGFAVLFLSLVALVVEQQKSQTLANAAQKEGSALMDLAQSRGQQLQRKSTESFAEYEKRVSAETEETQTLYAKLHAAEVARLRARLAHLGFHKAELDEFYNRPDSAVAIGEIGRILSDLSDELRSQGAWQIVKSRLKRTKR
jgi:hypothetical protein